METNEIIARANEAVQEIYEKMGRIESCEAALKALDGAEVYIGRDKNEILDLHAALNDDQIADIMTNIHTVIKAQIDKAADELSIMCGKDAGQQHEPEQCKTEQNEPENRVPEQCEPEKQEIEQNVPEQNLHPEGFSPPRHCFGIPKAGDRRVAGTCGDLSDSQQAQRRLDCSLSAFRI